MTVAAQAALPAEKPRSNAWRVLRRFLRSPSAVAGAAVVIGFVVVAVLAPLIAPYDPIKTNWLAVRKPPSDLFWFGTDDLGRDVLSRLIHGARASLTAGVISVTIAFLIGVPVGLLAGYVGGWVDSAVMRVIDAMGDGTGAIMLDGKMEDDASVKQCKVVVQLARELAARDPELAQSYGF